MSESIEAVLDDKELQQFLTGVKKRFANSSEANKIFAGIAYSRVFRDVIDHFQHEMGPSGPWKAWSTAYDAHMRKIGKGGNRILQDTGRLRQSLKIAPTQPNDGVLFINPAKTSLGFPYAAAHDTGGRKLPQRKFMWVGPVAMEDIGKMFLNYVLDEG